MAVVAELVALGPSVGQASAAPGGVPAALGKERGLVEAQVHLLFDFKFVPMMKNCQFLNV